MAVCNHAISLANGDGSSIFYYLVRQRLRFLLRIGLASRISKSTAAAAAGKAALHKLSNFWK
jgi:hypothetical protein